MPNVTVPGANHSVITLSYDRDANALIALQVAGAISAGLANHTIIAADNANGSPPMLPPGDTGELVLSKSGVTMAPKGYDYLVDYTKSANVFGNGDANEQVLTGDENLTFFATGGSGTIAGGGGKDAITIAAADPRRLVHRPWRWRRHHPRHGFGAPTRSAPARAIT